MPVTVEQLRQDLPRPGGSFLLSAQQWQIPELLTVLGLSTEAVLDDCTADVLRLTVTGTVTTPVGAVRVALGFRPDPDDNLVVGLTAEVELDAGIAELAERLGADLSGLPGAFLVALSAVGIAYNLETGTVVVLVRTEQVRLVLAASSPGGGPVVLAGLVDSGATVSELPHIGGLVPDGDRLGVRGLEALAIGPQGLTAADGQSLNTALRNAVGDSDEWWPRLPDRALTGGLWLGVDYVLPEEDGVWVTQVGVPTPSRVPGFPSLDLSLGRFRLNWSGLELTWGSGGGGSGGWDLTVSLDLSLDLGWLAIGMPEVAFDFRLPDVGAWSVRPRLPALSLDLGGPVRFEIPLLPRPDLPGFPGLPVPGLGIVTGWFDGGGVPLPGLLALFDIRLPALPSVFTPSLPRLGLRIDLELGDFELSGLSERLRLVLAALPEGPDWGRIALLGVNGLKALLGDLPFIGDLLGGFPDFALNGITLASLSGITLPELSLGRLNAWTDTLDLNGWWPSWSPSSGGRDPDGRPGNGVSWPGVSLDLSWGRPNLPPLDWGIPWPPSGLPTPDLGWVTFPELSFGQLRISGIGLSRPDPADLHWPTPGDWVLRLEFDVSFQFGGFSLRLPQLGFDVDLDAFKVHPRLPAIGFTLTVPGLPDVTLDFSVPRPDLPPGDWPFAISASWSREEGVSAADVASFLGLSAIGEGIPEFLMARLYSVDLHLDFGSWLLVVAGATGIGPWQSAAWLFATQPVNNPNRRKLMAVRGAIELKGSDLPASTDTVQWASDVIMSGIHLSYADQYWNRNEILGLNAYLATLDPPGSVPLPDFLPVDLPQGMQVWGELRVGDLLEVTLVYPDRDDLPGLRAAPYGSSSSASLLGYALGAIRFEHARLGLGYGTVYLAVDATMSVGPLTIQLLGLGFGIDKDFDARPVLEGAALGLERKGPPRIVIAGALSNLDLGPSFGLSLAGLGRIEVENLWAFQVAGSWATSTAGWTSLFAYAELTSLKQGLFQGLFNIGPVLFTGVALGFGVNSTVRVPSAADIGRFPLVKRLGVTPGADGEIERLTPGQALNELAGPGGWVTPAQGQYWGAGGAQFTVYQFINARALVLVEVGQAGWKAMLAGSTSLELPPTALQPLGRVTVDFAFVYDSALGRMSMDSVIAKGSYLIDPAMVLTGGVSLHVWGKDVPAQGIAKGFALTVGGYHPQYRAPVHYPRPPRVGVLWERGPITIKGHVYAALTDGAFMVGGSVAAVYEAKHGITVRAWFTSHFDALVQWKPFYADIAWGIGIGVSASVKVAFIRIKVSIEVGVDLQLWLPPLGGRARIKLWFVSFTLGFGADRAGAPPVPWEDFYIQLPPTRTSPDRVALPGATTDQSEARASGEAPHLVPMDGCTITVASGLPASKITVNGDRVAGSDQATIDIRPMRLEDVTSVQHVRIGYRGADFDWESAGWTVTELEEGMPQALWGKPPADPDKALNDPGLVPDCLAGLLITIPPPDQGDPLGPVTSAALDVTPLEPGLMPLQDESTAGLPPTSAPGSVEVITTTLDQEATVTARSLVHQALAALGCAPHSDGPLERYAVLAGTTLTDPPMLAATGAR